MNSFRQNYGLRWQRERLQVADLKDHAITAGILIFLLLAFGIVGSMDYAAELCRA